MRPANNNHLDQYRARKQAANFMRRPLAYARGTVPVPNVRLSMNKTLRRKLCWQWLAVMSLVAMAFVSVSAATCEGLAELKLPNTTITAAQSVAMGEFAPPGSAAPYKELPAFCRVAGVIKPTNDSEIKFEVWLPSANWNGKFHGIGNGGFAGS